MRPSHRRLPPLDPEGTYILKHREFQSYFGAEARNTLQRPGTVRDREKARLWTGAELLAGAEFFWADEWAAISYGVTVVPESGAVSVAVP